MNQSIYPRILPSFTHPHIHLPSQPLIPPFSCSPMFPSFRPSIHPCSHPFIYLPLNQPTPTLTSTYSPTYLCICPSTFLLTHSFTHLSNHHALLLFLSPSFLPPSALSFLLSLILPLLPPDPSLGSPSGQACLRWHTASPFSSLKSFSSTT